MFKERWQNFFFNVWRFHTVGGTALLDDLLRNRWRQSKVGAIKNSLCLRTCIERYVNKKRLWRYGRHMVTALIQRNANQLILIEVIANWLASCGYEQLRNDCWIEIVYILRSENEFVRPVGLVYITVQLIGKVLQSLKNYFRRFEKQKHVWHIYLHLNFDLINWYSINAR